MRTIPNWLILLTWILLITLAVVVVYRLLTGTINTSGLLRDKGSGSGFSPARLQLLISTLTFCCYYLAQVVNNPNRDFPRVPKEMLMVMGGSHAFYLGSKSLKLLLETLRKPN